MKLFSSAVLSGLAIALPTIAHPTSTQTNSSSTLRWGPCPELQKLNVSSAWQCTTLDVPLDYQDQNDNRTLTLNLIRARASKQPSKGSVLYNPGGPGDGGRNALVNLVGATFEGFGPQYTGSEYDLVSWDPRGTGAGEGLSVSCFATDEERLNFTSRIPNLTDSDASIAKAWEVAGSLASACEKALAGKGDLLGTAYVARDMVQIVDALGEDGMLRFYGASYGTALGQIFAAMFPDKVDKMVLDGVLNPHQYVQGLDYQQLAATEAVLDGFVSACIGQTPELCVLALRDTSVRNLRQQIYSLFDQIAREPYSYGPDATQSIDIFNFRGLVLSQLYTPSSWAILADWLDAILSRDNDRVARLTAILSGSTAPAPPFPEMTGLERTTVIRASDTTIRTSNVSSVAPVARAFLAQSPHLGGYLAEAQPIVFAQWPFEAKERYTGDFNNVQTRNPILFVGNVFDPITSLDAARNASETFAGSRLLVREGYGHTSQAQASNCTALALAAYFVNGTLPKEGTICNVNVPIFFNATLSAPFTTP